MKKILYLAVLLVAGCGESSDIMGLDKKEGDNTVGSAVTVDASKLTEDKEVQRVLNKRTGSTTDLYELNHNEEVRKYQVSKNKLDLEFKSLADQFEIECMLSDRMVDSGYCHVLRDDAMMIDESLRKLHIEHIDRMNTLRVEYTNSINEIVDDVRTTDL
ncbi:hypothetical protein VCHA53O466_40068 [Vibrio chagasii]|nr:hypothetical protein VCHA53O466_40068 [Vibrio chagasii]